MWLGRHQDKSIAQYASWPPLGSIWICRLKHQTTGGKLIQISIITTPTQQRLAVHFRNWTQSTGGIDRRKRTQSTPISPMWRVAYSLSYYMVSEWRPAVPFAEVFSAGGSLLHPITRFWPALTQNWIPRTKKRTQKWRKRRRKEHCAEWPEFMTFGRCGTVANTYVLSRSNLGLKTRRWHP